MRMSAEVPLWPGAARFGEWGGGHYSHMSWGIHLLMRFPGESVNGWQQVCRTQGLHWTHLLNCQASLDKAFLTSVRLARFHRQNGISIIQERQGVMTCDSNLCGTVTRTFLMPTVFAQTPGSHGFPANRAGDHWRLQFWCVTASCLGGAMRRLKLLPLRTWVATWRTWRSV